MSRKQIPLPNLRDTLRNFKLDMLANFNCHRAGIIQSFDTTNQTATVQLVDKRVMTTYESSLPVLRDFPILQDCPVFMNSDNFAGFRRPILEGDECLVIFNDRDIDNWFTYGTIGQPNSNRMHSLSDGLAIVGFNSKIKSIDDYNNLSSSMRYDQTLIELTDKIKFQNAVTSLKNIIDGLITIITSLKTVNGVDEYPIDAATAVSLMDLSTEVGELLE